MLIPRQAVPALKIETLAHGTFDLQAQTPEFATLVVFYRGLHCPICATYLKELQRLMPDFAERGIHPIAISSDTKERAEEFVKRADLNALPVGYGLPLAEARKWGLYISTSRGPTSIGIDEPALFSEPGLFFVKPDHTLYFGSVQTMPFSRPVFKDMLPSLDFVKKVDYPARGEYTGAV
ncbi:AhpC/TSA family protein [Stappia sp. F7233]|uniref:AhpC/TSA family protein n=1 Tax=Stappia albiluteola TaxID=2758565 RepID=A0A839AD43_9HYPH|nr:peroxiredoxin-like family protein [Stappia albiluteola]MBA5777690.1 AhpC/TSA family protein [Stappia albiluteola]